jgi:adenylate cyclase
MGPIVVDRRIRLRSPRAAVWGIVRDTERINLAIGSSPLTVERLASGPARFHIRSATGGVPVEFDEAPYDWVEGEFLGFTRNNTGHPVKQLRARYAVADLEGGGTEVHLHWELTPRWAVAWPIVWIGAMTQMARFTRYIAAIDAHLDHQTPLPLPEPPFDRARADRTARPLIERHPEATVRRLVDHLQRCSDLEAQAIRPFELADAWGADAEEVLRLCLAATREGLLELRWAILCPSCSQASETLPSLRELSERGHCHTCDIRFGVELDRAVEAVFEPHRSIRSIERRPMCIAGPMLTPHVIAQASGDGDTPAELRVPAEVGRYRVFARGGAAASVDVEAGAPERVEVRVDGDTATPPSITVAPGGSIEVAFDDGEARHAKLERVEWAFRAATAHHVSMLPEFRSQFGSEALREGLALRVARTTILFSDLCGSTALYSKVGDAAAFGVVTDCLAFGRAIVERHHGVVIKTMGDAVMAAFHDPAQAVAAGAAMILEWEELQAKDDLLRDLDLKVGVFGGPCTVVAANGVLDYFGQTVNSAARVQHLAGPRELLVPEAITDEVEAPAGTSYGPPFGARVKGIVEELMLRRCTVDAPVASAKVA